MNTYHISQMIPGIGLWQVVTDTDIVVASCDSLHKAKTLIAALEHAESGNPGNDMILKWGNYTEQ